MARLVKTVKLIMVSEVIGSGEIDDPVRTILEIWTANGNKLTEIDDINSSLADDLFKSTFL